MAKSLRVNYIFNMLNTVTGLLFPLITFPYASRIMLADGIGQVNFFQSITLLTCLGIPMYAIRKIASVRDDVAERNKVAIEILLLHATLSLIGYVIVALLAAFVSDIQVNIPLFFILGLTIFFTAIGCEWFYQGVEDFKYITIRGLIVKTDLSGPKKTSCGMPVIWYSVHWVAMHSTLSVYGNTFLGGTYRLRNCIHWCI